MTKKEIQQLRNNLAHFFSIYGQSEDEPKYLMVDEIICEVLSECDSEDDIIIPDHN